MKIMWMRKANDEKREKQAGPRRVRQTGTGREGRRSTGMCPRTSTQVLLASTTGADVAILEPGSNRAKVGRLGW